MEKRLIKSQSEWLGWRREDITASDIGAILGVDPRKSPMQVFAEKVGAAPEKAVTPEMHRGRILEPAVLLALKEERPKWVINSSKVYVRDPALKIGCTPDAVAEDPERCEDGASPRPFGIVQAKTVGSAEVFVRGWQGGEKDGQVVPPACYLYQTLTEIHLTGAAWGCLAVIVLTGFGLRFHLCPVERNEGAWEHIKRHVANFWETIDSGRPPRADFRLDGQAVEWLNPKDDGSELDLSGDNELPGLIAEYCHLRDHIAECEERKSEIGTIFKDRLGAASKALCAGGARLSWTLLERPEHLVKAWAGRVLRVRGGRSGKETAGSAGIQLEGRD